MTNKLPITILIAEDDPDDRFLIKEAFSENRLNNQYLHQNKSDNKLAQKSS